MIQRKGSQPHPPIEALMLVISSIAIRITSQELGLTLMDVSRAFYCAPVQHRIYVDIREEAIESEAGRNACANFKTSMYGTKAYMVRNTMTKSGFRAVRSSPTVFFQKARDLRSMVHGGNFVVVGPLEQFTRLRNQVEGELEITAMIILNDNKLAERRRPWADD